MNKILVPLLLLWTTTLSSVHSKNQDANNNCICFASSGSVVQTLQSKNDQTTKAPSPSWDVPGNHQEKWNRNKQKNTGVPPWGNNIMDYKPSSRNPPFIDSVEPWDRNKNQVPAPWNANPSDLPNPWQNSVNQESKNSKGNQENQESWNNKANQEPWNNKAFQEHQESWNNNINQQPWKVKGNKESWNHRGNQEKQESWNNKINKEWVSIRNVDSNVVDPFWKSVARNDKTNQGPNFNNDIKPIKLDSVRPWEINVNNGPNKNANDWQNNNDFTQSSENNFENWESKMNSQQLKDCIGSISDPQNLSVMPILIGNSMEVQHFLQHYESGKWPLQTPSPYIQAALIARNDPFHILKTLPLGKIIMPKPQNQFEENQMISRSGNSTNYGRLVEIQSQLPHSVGFSDLLTKTSHNRTNTISQPENNRNEGNFNEIDQRPQSNKQTQDSHNKFTNDPRTGQKPASVKEDWGPGSDENFPDAFTGNDGFGWPFENGFGLSRPDWMPLDPSDIENHNDDYFGNYDDSGEFKIIGGNAATGSGTPLNNKGRSGFIY